MSILTSSFNCMGVPFTSNEPNLSGKNPLIGGAFFIQDAQSVTAQNIQVENCYLGDVGGAFYL